MGARWSKKWQAKQLTKPAMAPQQLLSCRSAFIAKACATSLPEQIPWTSSAAWKKAVKAVVKELQKRSKTVEDPKEIAQVATISANNDEEIGEIIAKAMERVGKDGTITVEEAKGFETTLDVVEGMNFDRGYLSAYFMTNARNTRMHPRRCLYLHLREENLRHQRISSLFFKLLQKRTSPS